MFQFTIPNTRSGSDQRMDDLFLLTKDSMYEWCWHFSSQRLKRDSFGNHSPLDRAVQKSTKSKEMNQS